MAIVLDGTNGITQAGEFNSDSSFGFKNRIINGAMVIDQRNAGAAVTINTTSNTYTLDRWNAAGASSDGVFTVDQDTTAPTGFTNSLKVTVTTADASIGANQSYLLSQFIEGFNVADLGWGTASAKTITISFWVQSSVIGTFGGALNNSANSRNYPFTYAISVANTWEYKTVTIAGDTTGTWLTDAGRGIGLRFGFGMGSDFLATAGAWTGTSQIFGATGQTQLMSTLNATWYITGVQFEVGTQATSFEYRQYQQELALCQRYYYRLKAITATSRFANGFMANTTSGRAMVNFPVPMRSAVTALETSGTGSDYAIFYLAANAVCNAVPIFLNGTNVNTTVIMPTATTLTAGHGVQLAANSINAFLGFSVEL
jgi:hypothetical protein